MLPLIVERLQAEHPDSALHIRSVQDDGSGATVTITVEDLAGRSDQKQLCDSRSRPCAAKSLLPIYRARRSSGSSKPAYFETDAVRNGLGTLDAPTSDTYNIHGQAGAVGQNAHAHDMTFQQVWNQSSIDLSRLAEELTRLRAAMKQETEGTREQDKAIVAVADAEEAAIKGDGPTTLQHLKTAGKWTLGVAEKIGVAVAAEAIKRVM